MLENVIKKLFPIRDEKGRPCTFPTFASQVFFNDGTVLEGKEFGGGGSVDPLTIYPVGSIYMSVNETSPASLFGGTWEQLKDRFLLGAGDSYAVGSTGGESAHKLTTSEMPNHVHGRLAANGDGNYQIAYGVGDAVVTQAGRINLTPGNGAYPLSVAAQGGDQAHNNMPPYLAVYMWVRVS